MNSIAIACYVIHDCVYHSCLKIGIGLIITCYAMSYVVTPYILGNPLKILINSTIVPFQLFIGYFVLFYVIPFFDRQRQYQIPALFLTNQVSRSDFFWGTVAGFSLILLGSLVFFYMSAIVFLAYYTSTMMWFLLPAFIIIAVEGFFLVTMSIFFSLLVAHQLCYAIIIALYIISYNNHTWLLFVQKKLSGLSYALGLLCYFMLPDFNILDIKNQIIYQLPCNEFFFGGMVLYLFLFCFTFLLLGLNLFTQKSMV